MQRLLTLASAATLSCNASQRFHRHILSNLVCLGRHTLSGILCAGGMAEQDWSADYRLYNKNRVTVERLFEVIGTEVLRKGCADQPLVCALDDTLLRKTGKKIPGVKYARDPMGPPFAVNFVRGQRVIQLSASVSDDGKCARMVPVIFKDAPSADKPRKTESQEKWDAYKELQKQRNLSRYGTRCIEEMRTYMNKHGQEERDLWLTVDGSYTNKTVLRNLPDGVTLIGRIRGDAKLYYPVVKPRSGRGRTRIYGEKAPTPDMVKVDETIPWKTVQAYASGKTHNFRVKTIRAVRWRASGDAHLLQLVVIAPLHYRLTKKSRLLYRNPTFLIATDPDSTVEHILQAYLWRWDIEVNFRDEKTLLGLGQAQVRNQNAVAKVPQMMVAAYALLLISSINCFGVQGCPLTLLLPKWQKLVKKNRASTHDLIKAVRMELWADAIIERNLSHFVNHNTPDAKSFKNMVSLKSALFYASA
jgi:hypothetical protein